MTSLDNNIYKWEDNGNKKFDDKNTIKAGIVVHEGVELFISLFDGLAWGPAPNCCWLCLSLELECAFNPVNKQSHDKAPAPQSQKNL